MSDATALFERHLDLRPLRGRDRGLVRCRFHEDRTGSLSVDVARGLFTCFGCGAQGGVKRFAELVGEGQQSTSRPRGARESEGTRARREVLARERSMAARRVEWLPFSLANDHARRCATAAIAARRWAQVLGLDHPRTWPLLERAAQVHTEGLAVEAELDALLEQGRLDEDDRVEIILDRVTGRRP